jgi:competence protein ComEC
VLLAGCVVWRLFPATSSLVRITFLDVGQGEAILVETPGPRRMLVDAGGRIGESFDLGQNAIAPFLLHEWVGRLDVLVLTHPESDHMGGAPALLKAFVVGEVWTGAGPAVSGPDVWIQEFLRLRRIPHRIVAAGSPVDWGGAVEVLHPPRERNLLPSPRTKANNRSIVLRIRMGHQRSLLTGDIEREAENLLVASGMPLAADVLKVPHHGSRNSSTEGFLAAVRPRAVIVSVGYRNPYRHPHPLILERYGALGVRVFRTDREGAITVEMQADTIRIWPRRGAELVLSEARQARRYWKISS